MALVEFSGSAGSLSVAGRVLQVSIAGTVLFLVAPPDEAAAADAGEALVLAAAGAALAGSAWAEWDVANLDSPERLHMLGRRVEQELVAGLSSRTSARVIELYVRCVDQAQAPQPEPQPEVAAQPEPAAARAPAEAALAPGARLYVAWSDGRWHPAVCLQEAPGYVLADLGGGHVHWVPRTHCAPG